MISHPIEIYWNAHGKLNIISSRKYDEGRNNNDERNSAVELLISSFTTHMKLSERDYMHALNMVQVGVRLRFYVDNQLIRFIYLN